MLYKDEKEVEPAGRYITRLPHTKEDVDAAVMNLVRNALIAIL